MKPQAVYDEVKIESTEPVSTADYEVPVTAITEETVDIKMECNEAYAAVNTL